MAEVGLATLRVADHRLARPTSPLRRLANWLVPPAEAKGATDGPARSAVAGRRPAGRRRLRGRRLQQQPGRQGGTAPSGLQLIDTRTWTVRTLDPHTSGIVLAGDRLFATGYRYDSNDGVPEGYGLTIYGPGDRRPVHLMGSDEVWGVQVHGDLAYVRRGSGYSVVDLRSNRVLRHRQQDLPAFLEPAHP